MTESFVTQPRRMVAGSGFALLALGGCVLTVGVVLLAVVGAPRHDRLITLTVSALNVALPIGLGLFRLAKKPDDRFARLLIGAGVLWAIVTFAWSSESILYSVGRVAVWVVELALVYVTLAFPYGRLVADIDRRLFRAGVVLVGLLYLPSALLADYPQPSPWGSCGSHCPHNAFVVGNGAGAFVHDVVRPLREVLTFLLFAAVAALLIRRARNGPKVMRHTIAPVAAVAAFRALALGSYDALRAAGVQSGLTEAVGWIYVGSLALITLSFAAGLLDQRLFVARALSRLTGALTPHADAEEIRAALALALDDPTLRLYRTRGDPPRWVDEGGRPAPAPEGGEGRAVTQVGDDGRPVAALVHDVALAQDAALLQGAAAYALTALENDRLVGELESSLEDLSNSRARIAAAASGERRRIERDLHDGAQQRLVALRVRLALVAERLEAESPAGAEAIRALEGEIDGTIDEVRAFARGIYPSLLAERGLTEALRAAGRAAPVPTTVDVGAIGRYPPEVEAAVYFSCMEALQNSIKHASGASGVEVTVTRNPHLRFEVSDDGCGFDPGHTTPGTGITHLRDRLEAVGGELRIESRPGGGTRVTGILPV